MNVVEELKEQIEQRKKKSLELMLNDKVRLITDVLGKPFSSISSHCGGNLMGDYSVEERGARYKDRNFEIRMVAYTYDDGSGNSNVDILMRQPCKIPIFHQRLPVYEFKQSFSKDDTREYPVEINVFCDEDKWLENFNKLYQRASNVLNKRKEDEQRRKDFEHQEVLRKTKASYGLQ